MKTINKISKVKTFLVAITCFITLNSCNNNECKYNDQDTFPFSCDGGMDVAFVIDYTGSMGTAINGIKTAVASIVSTIVTESGGDYRLSLSIFDEYSKAQNATYFTNADYTSLPAANKIINTTGTTTNQYLTMMEKFGTANTATFSSQLAKLNGSMPLGNGNGFAEPGGMLMSEIVNNAFAGTWRPGKTKIMIIITDAPDGGDDDNNTAIDDAYLSALAIQANAQNIQCILVTTLPTANYEISLINNNTAGVALVRPDFSTIATDIKTLIENLCIANDN